MNKIDITVDFHTHILPNIDDGSKSLDNSVYLIKKAISAGVRTICLTPHYYAHRRYPDAFCERRDAAYERLARRLEQESIEVGLLRGAEVLVFPGLQRLDGIERLTLEGTDTLLLEMPLSEELITEEYYSTVEELSRKYRIVMAHANRYSDDVVEKMLEAGVSIQVNAADVCSHWQRRRTAFWLERGYIVALGSDAHRSASVYSKYKKAARILSK